MTDLSGARIAVAGAGALGSAVALHLAECGAEVLLADPALVGDNASGVAAGMLAPVMEALLDETSAGHLDLLRQGRDAWPGFVERMAGALAIDRCGALWLSDEGTADAMLARMAQIGAAGEPISAAKAAALSPGLTPTPGIHTPEDWRIEPHPMLKAMRSALIRRRGRVVQAAVARAGEGFVLLSDGERWTADWTVIACGHPSALSVRLAPELAGLTPVKGQILRFEPGAAPASGPIVRTEGVYVAPGEAGPAAGATMEQGVDDRRAEPQAADRLRAAASVLYPRLARAPALAQAAVRSATGDGLPLVGPSAAPGVIVAAGARRNGWLLAPLVAEIVADHCAGRAASPAAAAFDAGRFDRPQA